MISAYELQMMTAQTKAFIDADVEEVQMEPRLVRTSDGAGGWLQAPSPPMLPLRVRLIPQSDRVPAAVAVEGTRPVPDFVLFAMPGSDVERYDTFDWQGRKWEISFIHDKPDYALKADVVVHAG